MPLLPINAAEAIIGTSPVASAIVRRSGAVVCVNSALTTKYAKAKGAVSLAEIFEDSDAFAKAMHRAARGSVTLPDNMTLADGRTKASIEIRPLDCSDGQPATLFLVTLRGRSAAWRKMLSLKQELDEATIQHRHLLEQNRALKKTVETSIPKLRALSYTDPLTGVHNRRFYDRQLEREWQRIQRGHDPLSLIFIDIDHFKLYNDTYGHPKGDACLRQIATILSTIVTRRLDTICRIGGEEFAFVLPMTNSTGASEIAHRALSAVRNLAIPQADGNIVTISAGVGTCQPGQNHDREAFIHSVDKALYRSKALGRDRVTAVNDWGPQNTPKISAHDNQPYI